MARSVILLVSLLSFTSTFTSRVHASPATPPQITFVALLTDTGQALVLDRNQGAYVLVRLGDLLDGYNVVAVDAAELILQSQTETKRQFVFAPSGRLPGLTSGLGDATLSAPPAAPQHSGPVVVTPVPPPATGLLDPYGPSADPAVDPEGPARQPSPAALPPTVIRPQSSQLTLQEEIQTVQRAEFDRATADFHRLSKEVQLVRVPEGVRLVELAGGSFFHRLGLRKDDTVRTIDGVMIQDLDDAASVYAQLLTATGFVIEVQRADKRISLRYKFREEKRF